MLLDRQHLPMFDHAVASIRVVCDRGISHEIVRHRVGVGYAQESTRYCNYARGKFGNEISVIEPPELSLEARYCWVTACLDSEDKYLTMVGCGTPAQLARDVLPTCLKTEIVITATFTYWMHFLRLRLTKQAHPKMRQVARLVADVLISVCPEIFGRVVEDAEA